MDMGTAFLSGDMAILAKKREIIDIYIFILSSLLGHLGHVLGYLGNIVNIAKISTPRSLAMLLWPCCMNQQLSGSEPLGTTGTMQAPGDHKPELSTSMTTAAIYARSREIRQGGQNRIRGTKRLI